MKITAIELSEIKISEIVNYLTSKFNTEDEKQTIEFDLSELPEFEDVDNFQVEAELKLSTYMSDFDENHQTEITDRYVEFRITFFYDGEEIKVNADLIWQKIVDYYEIHKH